MPNPDPGNETKITVASLSAGETDALRELVPAPIPVRTLSGFTIDGSIDPSEAPDRDDALGCKLTPEGLLVQVSITDVDSLVQKGSPIDAAARVKGRSRYHLTPCDHMLPGELAEDRLSLIEGTERPVVSVGLLFSPAGTLLRPTASCTQLSVERNFSYRTAAALLSQVSGSLPEQLRMLSQLSLSLYSQRQSRDGGSRYDFETGEVIDESGARTFVGEKELSTYMLVAELMIAANSAIARLMFAQKRPFIYRNHPSPQSDGRASRAYYSVSNDGHFALNTGAYAPFTSPIRRYVDLVNQRLVKSFLQGMPSPYTDAELDEIANQQNTHGTVMGSPEERKAHFMRVIQTAEETGLAGLSPSQLSLVVRSRAGVPLASARAQEVHRAIDQALLNEEARGLVLLRSLESDPEWSKVRTHMLAQILSGALPPRGIIHNWRQENWILVSTLDHFIRHGAVVEPVTIGRVVLRDRAECVAVKEVSAQDQRSYRQAEMLLLCALSRVTPEALLSGEFHLSERSRSELEQAVAVRVELSSEEYSDLVPYRRIEGSSRGLLRPITRQEMMHLLFNPEYSNNIWDEIRQSFLSPLPSHTPFDYFAFLKEAMKTGFVEEFYARAGTTAEGTRKKSVHLRVHGKDHDFEVEDPNRRAKLRAALKAVMRLIVEEGTPNN
ncbi:MAG: RNB domain-containing ribonuclease [Oligoflexia bacterium]|nr:RNB domain-containing ribonuclease [Oligoflexia bacterium]